jgi:hypothetical protein
VWSAYWIASSGAVRRVALAAGGVGGGQVVGERGQRPLVGGEVVHDQHEDVLVTGLDQRRDHRDRRRDVDHRARSVVDGGLEVVGAAHRRPRHGGLGDDVLARDAVVVLDRDRAQRLVPGDEVADRGAQRVPVELAAQAQHGGDVVGRRRPVQAVQEPQPLLGG